MIDEGVRYHRLGGTRKGGALRVETGEGRLDLSLDDLASAHTGSVAELFG